MYHYKNWYIVCATKCCLCSCPLAENQQWNGEKYREGRQRRPTASIRGERNTLIFFSMEKDLPKGEIATKPNHYKLEIVFTAPRNRTTKGTKLNYNTKGLRQIKYFCLSNFQDCINVLLNLLPQNAVKLKSIKISLKKAGQSHRSQSVAVEHDGSDANSPLSCSKIRLPKWLL